MDSEGAPIWPWVASGIGILILGGGAVVVWGKTRGLRNNNPGNVRPLASGATWAGQVGIDNARGGPFVIFGEHLGKPGEFWGLRCVARILTNYQKNNGLYTVAGMINRWAPPHENDTSAYALNVADALGVAVDRPIDLTNNKPLLAAMVKAITREENGINPYPDALVAAAVEAA